MKTLNAIGFQEANENTKAVFTAVKNKIGMVPNLYAAIGVSDKALSGFLNFTETLKSGVFSAKEYEAIALVTSQENGCNYCLAAHTAIGKMNGFSEEETIALRLGTIEDKNLNALIHLVTGLLKNNGKPTSLELTDFINAGYNNAAFVELIAIVSLTTFTNNIFHNGNFEIDFPKAQNTVQNQTI